MGLKSNKQWGRIYVAPLSLQGEIIVLSGSPVQTYDKQLREYSPDPDTTGHRTEGIGIRREYCIR